MTRVVVISINDRVYGVKKSIELLGINSMKGKKVIFKPNFNTADPPPVSSHIETIWQIISKLKEMGAKAIVFSRKKWPCQNCRDF